MIESVIVDLKNLGPLVSIAVGITVLLGTGSAVNWWITRRIDNRVKHEVNHIDRLQPINEKVANMATKEDLAEVRTKVVGVEKKVVRVEKKVVRMEARMDSMATKEDLAEVRTKIVGMEVRMDNMATKEDLAKMEAKMDNMATKEDLAKMEAKVVGMEAKVDNMATGMDNLKTDLLEAINNMNGNAHR